jgi:hypothetical protein
MSVAAATAKPDHISTAAGAKAIVEALFSVLAAMPRGSC